MIQSLPPRRVRKIARMGGVCFCLVATALTACVRNGGNAAQQDVGVPAPSTATEVIAEVTMVTVEADKPRQVLAGFGAATAYYQNWIVSHPHKKEIYDALFKDLNLDILRLQNGYRPKKESTFAKDDGDIVAGAKASLGHPVTILMSSWSPPAALKSTKNEKNGGTLAKNSKGAFVYGGFAQYWYDALNAYRKAGIVPTYISIQNEPDWKAEWETCLFEPTEMVKNGVAYAGYDRAFDAVYKKLATFPNPPKMLGPETLGIGEGRVQKYLDAHNKTRLARVYAVAHHLYNGGTHLAPDTFVPQLHALRDAYPDKPRFQTEFGRSDGLQTAWVIHNCLVEEEASAYIYWAALWPGDDCLITMENPWQQSQWKFPNGFRLNDRYFALKHYSYFIAPGYRRVEATTAANNGPVKTSAFLSPHADRLVIVTINTSETETKTVAWNLRGFTRGNTTEVYQTIFPPTASSPATGSEAVSEPFKNLGALGADNRITLPPHSIVTITIQGQGAVSPL